MRCRVIGVIEGEQGKKKQSTRNDRIVAVEEENHSYAHVKHIKDLAEKFVEELEEFFVNYHDLSGKKYRVVDVRGPPEARKRIENRVHEAQNHSRLQGPFTASSVSSDARTKE